jgi:hypothetical protein
VRRRRLTDGWKREAKGTYLSFGKRESTGFLILGYSRGCAGRMTQKN